MLPHIIQVGAQDAEPVWQDGRAVYVTTESIALCAQYQQVNGRACLPIENALIPSALEREEDLFAFLVLYRA